MKRKRNCQDLVDLGAASKETKGGPWGMDDYRASLMLGTAGLTRD